MMKYVYVCSGSLTQLCYTYIMNDINAQDNCIKLKQRGRWFIANNHNQIVSCHVFHSITSFYRSRTMCHDVIRLIKFTTYIGYD